MVVQFNFCLVCKFWVARWNFEIICFTGQVLQSQIQRWCWGASKPSPQTGPSSRCLSWHSGCPGPDRDSSSCCACACTMVSSPWWTSNTARCWLTWQSPPLIAHASTSTAPCSALWAQLRFSSHTPSGTRRISTPSDFSVWLWQLFPWWDFCLCPTCSSTVSNRKSLWDAMKHRPLKSKRTGRWTAVLWLTPLISLHSSFVTPQTDCWGFTCPFRQTGHNSTVPQAALQTQELYVVCINESCPGKKKISCCVYFD